MAEFKFTYFDIDGGRGEVTRIALHAAGAEFQDNRLSFAEFSEQRGALRFNAVPTFEIDGEQFSQSDAISRYVGRLANLYPADRLQALYCDEVLGAYEDLTHFVVRTFGLEGDRLKEARQQLLDGKMTVYLTALEKLLARGGGEYFADQQLTIADLRSFVQVRSLLAGVLDHIPADFVRSVAPELADHHDRIAQAACVVAYYRSRQPGSP